MRLKKLGAALVVVAALGAVLASSALAAAVTEDVKWYTGAAPGTELSGTAAVTSEQVGEATMATTVSGQAIELHSTNVKCSGCIIENSGGTAIASGKVEFTGVTVAKPSGCGVASTITTKALKVKADYMIGSTAYTLVEPAAGSETGFATVELTGASCPIKTAIIPKGIVFCQWSNSTGTQATEHTASGSAAINSTAGGSLHVGTETLTVTGTMKGKLSSGVAYGAH